MIRRSTLVAALVLILLPALASAVDERLGAYATWNPDDRDPQIVLSADLLTAYRAEFVPAGWSAVRATVPLTAGEWYWETTIRFSQGSDILSGLTFGLNPLDVSPGTYEGLVGPDKSGNCYWNGIVEAVTGPPLVGSVIRHWVNINLRFYRVSVDGAPWVSIHEEAEQGSLPVSVVPIAAILRAADGPASITANFGDAPFAYVVPPGANPGVYKADPIMNNGFDAAQ